MDQFTIPEDIAALSASEIDEAITAARAEAAALGEIADADLTDEQIDRLDALAGFVTGALAAQEAAAAAAAARAEKIAASKAALSAAHPSEEDGEDEEEAEVEQAEVEAVTAAAPPKPKVPAAVRAAAKRGTKAEEEAQGMGTRARIIAAADVPEFSTGAVLADLDEVGKAVGNRMASFTQSSGMGQRLNRYGAARIFKGRSDDLVARTEADGQRVVMEAANEARLAGGSLIAAGGWCAPSETLYDLCTAESTDGLWDLPEVGVNRGGIRFTKGPSFADIYDDGNIGFWLTEAQVIAGEEKTCLEIECPPFVDIRLDAVGICIRVPLLTEVGYPELVRRWIEGALIAHQHKVSGTLLARAVTGSQQVNLTGDFASQVDTLAELEMVAEFRRQQWRMSFDATMEVVAPVWAKAVFRADLARRNGEAQTNVTDAQIDAHFANRRLRVQYVYNWQPLTSTGTAPTVNVEVPDTIQYLMYPAGTWVKGTTDVINLDAVYDAASLAQNMYTALFVEEGVLLANTCFDSAVITTPVLATGRTGANDITTDLFTAVTP